MANSNQNQSDNLDAQRLYLDFDSFFATAEQYFNADLRGKPLGVVPLDTPYTSCIAISREAKIAGVPSGATITDARAVCPNMMFVVARPDAYVRLHHQILEVIETCLPIAKVRSIDELVCHLNASDAKDPALLARNIKNALAQKFSDMLTCSIGVARTEMLAKVGAEMNKPDGFTYLRSDNLPRSLIHLKLNDLPGISNGIENRLNASGIYDIEGLWNIGAKHARAIWGNVEGERFWSSLHGHPVERPKTKKRMFGHSRMLPLDWRTPQKIERCARQLLLGAARRLRRDDVQATKLTLAMRGGGYRSRTGSKKNGLRWSHEISFLATRDDQTLLNALSNIFHYAKTEVTYVPRSVSVMIHGLIENQLVQQDLFGSFDEVDDLQARTEAKAKREKLSEVMDALRTKYGPTAASFGVYEEVPGGYLGAKIAFGRIPEEDDFSERPTLNSETQFLSS